jgi:hypothetical protein
MADEENNETTESEQGSGNGGNATRTAVKAAAAAAATGAAAVAVKKALSARSNGSDNGDDSGEGKSKSKKSGGSQSLMMSVASGSWDAAQDAILPLAGDAAAAAGKYLAQSGPDVVKDEIVPKFIDAFNEAK